MRHWNLDEHLQVLSSLRTTPRREKKVLGIASCIYCAWLERDSDSLVLSGAIMDGMVLPRHANERGAYPGAARLRVREGRIENNAMATVRLALGVGTSLFSLTMWTMVSCHHPRVILGIAYATGASGDGESIPFP